MSTPDSSPASKPLLEKPSLEKPSLEDGILRVLTRAGAPASTSLSAPEIAQAIDPSGDWHSLLMPIRRAAVALALSGRLIIYRKGKPADPNDFRGVYRLGLPRQD